MTNLRRNFGAFLAMAAVVLSPARSLTMHKQQQAQKSAPNRLAHCRRFIVKIR